MTSGPQTRSRARAELVRRMREVIAAIDRGEVRIGGDGHCAASVRQRLERRIVELEGRER
jgi:hypothetical protein